MVERILLVIILNVVIIFYWDNLVKLLQRMLKGLAKRSKKSSLKSGQQLMLYIQNFTNSALPTASGPEGVASYKFFTALFLEVVGLRRELGSSLSETTLEIRKGLLDDLQQERKCAKEANNAWMQMIFLSIITWAFIFFVTYLMKIEHFSGTYFIIALLQLAGAMVYFSVAKLAKKHFFKGHSEFLRCILVFKIYLSARLPVKEVLYRSKVQGVVDSNYRSFKVVSMRFQRMILSWKGIGAPITQDLAELTSEIWFIYQENFESYVKFIGALKFFVLALFFMSSYFLFLLKLIKAFL